MPTTATLSHDDATAPADGQPHAQPRLQVSRPSNPRSSGRLKAIAAFLALCLIWGSTWLAIKVGLRDLPPISFAGIRFVLAAMILYAIIAFRGVRLPWAARDWRLLAWTGLLTITINYALVFWAELHISSGLAAVLNATIPLFGLPLAHRALHAEPMTAHKVGGVVLGVLGLAIVFGTELGGGDPLAAWASVGVLVASLAGAYAGVLIKAKGTHIDPAVLAGVQMTAGSIPLVAGGALLEGNPLRFAWTSFGGDLAGLSHRDGLGGRVSGLLLADPARPGVARAPDPAHHAAGGGGTGRDVPGRSGDMGNGGRRQHDPGRGRARDMERRSALNRPYSSSPWFL